MGTVAITFFLITQFYVFKMDVASKTRSRKKIQREQRWSMNSQRLEEIVAELMKPISDVRRSFDTDLSALLEEYLTEAGLHALDAEERGAPPAGPNFAELALLLQHSAAVYGRKVDLLYQHVLSISDSLLQSIQEIGESPASPAAAAEATPSAASARRKRKASAAAEGFAPLRPEGGAAARHEAAARPAPYLPRMYEELEPRVACDADVPLCDWDFEPIGLLADFHASWRLQDGAVVEEQKGARRDDGSAAALGPVPLHELSAAIAAAAPPSPPPSPGPRSRSPSPPPPPPSAASTPLPPPAAAPLPPTPQEHARRERKRRREPDPEDAPDAPLRLTVTPAVRRKLQQQQEFSVPDTWLRRVVRERCRDVLRRRGLLRAQPSHDTELRGFELADAMDVGGFAGWSSAEAEGAGATHALRRTCDSEDDGFFDAESDESRVNSSATTSSSSSSGGGGGGGADEWRSWRARVLARAAASEARGRDVRRAAAAVLAACATLPAGAPFRAVLQRTARDAADVPELFLATLFLATAGNVEIVQGPPLSVDSFGVRLLTADRRLYRSALAQLPPASDER